MASGIGTGTKVFFATSAFVLNITNVTPPAASRPSVKTSHMGTTTSDTFVPGDLVDWGEAELEGWYDPAAAVDPPVNGSAETAVIIYPDDSREAFSCFVTGWKRGVPIEDMMTCTLTIKVTGTPGSGSGSGSGTGTGA